MLTTTQASRLAEWLERMDNGAEQARRARLRSSVEVECLLELASRLQAIPPLEPDFGWLSASKRRLVARYRAHRGLGDTALSDDTVRRPRATAGGQAPRQAIPSHESRAFLRLEPRALQPST
jgi:hypothetical protein